MANQSTSYRSYVIIAAVVAAITFGITWLLFNVRDRKEEAKEVSFRLADLSEETIDPATWGKNFPRQYDGYKRTVDTVRTRHGGSEAFQKLDAEPLLRRIFAGYAFSIDYREERGQQALVDLYDEIKRAKDRGVTEKSLEEALQLQRKAQFRLDFVAAENSMGFHAPQEVARILAEAIDYARQGEIAAARSGK